VKEFVLKCKSWEGVVLLLVDAGSFSVIRFSKWQLKSVCSMYRK